MRGKQNGPTAGFVTSLVLAGAAFATSADLAAQTKSPTVPDAQVESNVLKALAGSPKLADQQISSSAVYGVVTLSGHVKDDATRSLAEDVVSRTAGVQKVIDELVLGDQAAATSATDPNAGPELQSDGTYTAAPAGSQTAGNQAPGASPAQDSQSQQPGYGTPPSQTGENSGYGSELPPSGQQAPAQGQPSYGGQPPYAQNQPPYGENQPPYPPQGQPQNGEAPYGQPSSSPSYPSRAQQPYPQGGQESQGGSYGQPPYGPAGQSQGSQSGQRYPPQNQPPYSARNDYPYGTPGAYGSGQPYPGGQPGGQPVSVAAGAVLQIRMDQGVDSQHSQVGMPFTGTVIRDVFANGLVAIPRGATVQGNVVDVSRAGVLKGRASLALQLTQLNLGGRTYPLASNLWAQNGGDKTVRTVDSALGLGAVGAIIGGVAGGGAGAAIGAGAGGAAGLGASAASGGGVVFLPPEAVISFQLTQPAEVTTVSQAEMLRLGYAVPGGVPPTMRRRYYPPPPFYYRPRYYAYPRAYYRPYPY